MTKQTLVSILIPTYNRVGLISEAIYSALAQTYSNIEVVVVDNASTDSTWQEIQDIAVNDPRVRAFRNSSNIGPVRNWIECVRHANGMYAKILWSDDLIHEDYLKETLPFLMNQDVGFVYTSARIFTHGNPPESGNVCYKSLATGVHPSSVYINGSLRNSGLPVSPGCAIFRTCDVQKNLWADIPTPSQSNFSRHAIGNDLLLFLLTANTYKSFAVLNRPLSSFRSHNSSITISSGQEKVDIHYDMIRAFFAEQFMSEKKGLIRELNAMIFLHLRNLGVDNFGLKNVSNFYSPDFKVEISLSSLFIQWSKSFVRSMRSVLSNFLSKNN